MSDDSGFDGGLEPIEIDDRSPGERWADSGRAGFGRVRDIVADARLDVAALVWMILVLALTGVQVYSAVRASTGISDSGGNHDDWWVKAQLLAGSGGIVLIFGSIVGTALAALAAFAESSSSRLAFQLAVAGGAWALFAGLLGVVVSFHSGDAFAFSLTGGAESKVISAVSYLSLGGLGAIVAVIAARIDPGPELS